MKNKSKDPIRNTWGQCMKWEIEYYGAIITILRQYFILRVRIMKVDN